MAYLPFKKGRTGGAGAFPCVHRVPPVCSRNRSPSQFCEGDRFLEHRGKRQPSMGSGVIACKIGPIHHFSNPSRQIPGVSMKDQLDPRVDAYIAEAAPFAQPILRHLRQLVHQGCPAAKENIKWNHPHFEYGGMFCHFAAFKAHCSFGFWHQEMMAVIAKDGGKSESAMGQFGRIATLEDLPDDRTLLRRPCSRRTRRPRPPGINSAIVIARNTWNGSPKQSGKRPGKRGSPRPLNG